ncbi:MAG TPA: BMP family protein [Acetobacteraceae bacterium]|nr:BMP family protein [Acetobacteraceae bacterium]
MRPSVLKLLLAALGLGLAATAAAPAQAKKLTTIAIVTPEQATDFGWNQQGVAGAQAAADKYHLKLLKAEGMGYGDIRPTLRDLVDQGAGLIIAHASGYNTAAVEIAKETHTPVAITDRPDLQQPGLVADYTLSGHEGAYLAGVLAAKMTKTGTLGIVVSAEVPDWNSQSAGFVQGAKAVDPNIKIRYAVIGPAAYSDVAGARRVTQSVIAAGADVIFGQGDGASFGMLQAVETVKSPSGDKVWFIDVIGDKSSIDKGHLLSSVVWNFEPVFGTMVAGLENGDFGVHKYQPNLKDGSISLLDTKHIPAAIWAEIEKTRQGIIDGTIKVAEVFDTQKVHAMMTSVQGSKK